MTPGSFLREARERRGLSLDDVALTLATDPHINAHDRAEWLALVEADRAPVTIDVGLVLSELLRIDFHHLVALVAVMAVHRLQATPIAESDHAPG